jgi:hypothetical protein
LGLGVPVVGTAVEGLPETLGEGRGVLVQPEKPEELAHAIDELLRGRGVPDPALGRRYAEQFTNERIAPYYADVYRRLTVRGTTLDRVNARQVNPTTPSIPIPRPPVRTFKRPHDSTLMVVQGAVPTASGGV